MTRGAATPLPRKLGIKEGSTVATPGAPESFRELLHPLPDGVTFPNRLRGPLDVIVFFTDRRAELEGRFARLAAALATTGGIWVAYPKRSSRIATDLDFATVQGIGLETGLVDNKSCAIDDVWTAVRFVVRLADRPKEVG